nr:hypothetical protein [uncultured bacterium]
MGISKGSDLGKRLYSHKMPLFNRLYLGLLPSFIYFTHFAKLEFVNTYYHKDIYLKFSFVFPNIL